MARHRRLLQFTALLLLIVAVAGVGSIIWWRICGNVPISFYGRVVDDAGRGMPDVEVTFRVWYSPTPALPIMYGVGESTWETTSTTDAAGDFQLRRTYGYGVGLSGVRANGHAMGLRASTVPLNDDPGYGVSMNDRSSRRKLPDTPAKRVSYRLVKLK